VPNAPQGKERLSLFTCSELGVFMTGWYSFYILNKQRAFPFEKDRIEQNTTAPSSFPKNFTSQNVLFGFVLQTTVKLDLIFLGPS
jgi:hypothetical protein